MKTIWDRITELRISATAERCDHNPNLDGMGRAEAFKETPVDMDHWRVTMRRPGAKMTVYFSMGLGHNGKEPTAAEVLSTLAMDAAGIDNASSFEDWCSEYGYDTDSRKAHRTYKACERQYQRLEKFIGDRDALTALMFDTESM